MIARPVMIGGAVLVGGLALYILAKRQPGQSLAGAVGTGAVGAVADVATGVIKGVGGVFGVPDTNMDQCSQDLAAGRTWDASFSCPASRFVGSVFNSTRIASADARDAAIVDAAIEQQQQDAAASSGFFTDEDQCSRDLAAGRTWDASFSCPASRFIGSVMSY